MKLLRIFATAAISIFASCSKPASDHGRATHTDHVHVAPHGGTLVELGEHAYNLEFVRDAASGKLSAYVLDAHAENFIRVKAQSFDISATVGTEKYPLSFRAVANAATGETVGDTSQFDAEAEWLKTTATFDAVLPAIEIRGTRFAAVAFAFPRGHGHD